MRNNYIYLLLLALGFIMWSCQKREFNAAPTKLSAPGNLAYNLAGDSVTLTWNLPGGDSIYPVLQSGASSVRLPLNATSYKYGIVETNKEYEFTLKLTDTKGNYSLGETVHFTRDGASPVSGLSAAQDESAVVVTWTAPKTAVSKIQVKMGTQTAEVNPTATSYRFNNVPLGAYTISVITTNAANQTSNTVYLPFRVGATAVAYLGIYADSTTLLNSGDDDEIAAAKWLFANYNTARYISFSQIKNGTVDLGHFRVLWWNYDVVAGKDLPAIALDATVVNNIKTYYKNGGNLLLNQYAMQYFWTLGRVTAPYFLEFGTGEGFNNPDAWGVGINIGRKHDHSTHPLYKNITLTRQSDNRVTFPVIGPGWKENHNAVIVRIPEFLNLMPNDNDAAYTKFCTDNNAAWLGVWDGIGDYFMAGIAEFQAKDDFQGTGIFFGIGGIEWNQNNSANPYQNNVQQLYKNAIEYLKTR